MERRSFAIVAVAVGLVMGLLGNILFFNHLIGISFPFYILLSVALVLILARPAQQIVNWRNLWPLLPLAFFAVMVAVRADDLIVSLNIMAVLSLGIVGLYYLSLTRPLDTESVGDYTKAVLETSFMVLPAAAIEGVEAWRWLRDKRNQRGGLLTAVVRGSLFALPIILVFAVLLGSADAVFAKYVNQAFDSVRQALGLEYLGETFARLTVTGLLAVVVAGSLGFGLLRRPTAVVIANPSSDAAESDDEKVLPDTKPKSKPSFKLSMVETSIIMGSVVALFAAFVGIQFAYFFGGEHTVQVAGITYSQYARRGFFELVAVSVLTLGLSLVLDHVSVRQSRRENNLFRVLALLIVGLTSVMLASASQRMWLYEQAFGFTQLRVYTHIFMLWLGVLFGFFVLAVFRLRMNIFSLGVVLAIIGYVVTLNLMNVDLYMADRNIARYHDGHELDMAFLNTLSSDAVPAVLPLWQQTKADETVHKWAGQWLMVRLGNLNTEFIGSGQFALSLNLSRRSAWESLYAVRDQLPVYDSDIYWNMDGYSQTGSIEERYGTEFDVTAVPAGE